METKCTRCGMRLNDLDNSKYLICPKCKRFTPSKKDCLKGGYVESKMVKTKKVKKAVVKKEEKQAEQPVVESTKTSPVLNIRKENATKLKNFMSCELKLSSDEMRKTMSNLYTTLSEELKCQKK